MELTWREEFESIKFTGQEIINQSRAFLSQLGEKRVSELNHSGLDIVNGASGLAVSEIDNHGTMAIVYRVGYKTSKGSEFVVDYTLVILDNDSKLSIDDFSNHELLVSKKELANYYSNCHGTTFGTGGIMHGQQTASTILKDEGYKPLKIEKESELKVGDVLVFDSDHSISVAGVDKKGNVTYESNFFEGEIIKGSWKDISVHLEDAGVANIWDDEKKQNHTTKPTDFKWSRKSANNKTQANEK